METNNMLTPHILFLHECMRTCYELFLYDKEQHLVHTAILDESSQDGNKV